MSGPTPPGGPEMGTNVHFDIERRGTHGGWEWVTGGSIDRNYGAYAALGIRDQFGMEPVDVTYPDPSEMSPMIRDDWDCRGEEYAGCVTLEALHEARRRHLAAERDEGFEAEGSVLDDAITAMEAAGGTARCLLFAIH